MTRTKQVNNENVAVLNRDYPSRGRSLIMGQEELKRLYPNAKPEHIEMALERFGDYECDEGDQILAKYKSQIGGQPNPFENDTPTEIDARPVEDDNGEGEDRPREGKHF